MNFEPDAGEAAFRDEVRAFAARTMTELFGDQPREWLSGGITRRSMQTWTRALAEHGWSVPDWPVEFGGTAWPATWRAVFRDELIAADCPPVDAIGLGFVGPVIYTFGSEEQKRRYLPRIRTGDEFWCQGFSESEAGSDVTSLRTIGIRQGDHFIVSGKKLWITNAHQADMMFALVRIDSPGNRRQQGLSFLLIDMRSDGLTVEPIITIDGRHRINAVHLESVRVPVDNLVGEQGKGWMYARFLLTRERTIVAGLPGTRYLLGALRKALHSEYTGGAPLIENAAHRLRLAELEVELKAVEFLELRVLRAADEDSAADVLASMLKLRGTELRQRVSEALWDASAERGLEFAVASPGVRQALDPNDSPPAEHMHWSTENYFFQRSASIVGGTSEIQRNIIAAVSLGL